MSNCQQGSCEQISAVQRTVNCTIQSHDAAHAVKAKPIPEGHLAVKGSQVQCGCVTGEPYTLDGSTWPSAELSGPGTSS